MRFDLLKLAFSYLFIKRFASQFLFEQWFVRAPWHPPSSSSLPAVLSLWMVPFLWDCSSHNSLSLIAKPYFFHFHSCFPIAWLSLSPHSLFLSFSFVSLFRFRFLSCIKRAWRLWREWSQRPLPHEDPTGTSVFSFNSYLPHFGSFPWQRLLREWAGARSPAKPSLVLDRCLRRKKKP